MYHRDFAECGALVYGGPWACLPWTAPPVGSATRFPNLQVSSRFDPTSGMLSPMSVTLVAHPPFRPQLTGKRLEPVLPRRRDSVTVRVYSQPPESCCGSESCLVSTCVWFEKHASTSRYSSGTCSCSGCDPLGGAQLLEASGCDNMSRVYISKERLQSTQSGPVYFPVGSTHHRNSSAEQASIEGHKDRLKGVWGICGNGV